MDQFGNKAPGNPHDYYDGRYYQPSQQQSLQQYHSQQQYQQQHQHQLHEFQHQPAQGICHHPQPQTGHHHHPQYLYANIAPESLSNSSIPSLDHDHLEQPYSHAYANYVSGYDISRLQMGNNDYASSTALPHNDVYLPSDTQHIVQNQYGNQELQNREQRQQQNQSQYQRQQQSQVKPHSIKKDPLIDFTMEISSLSLKPLSAKQIIDIVQFACNEVETKYLPCVDFLVTCQQDLRNGLASATKKVMRNRSYTPTLTAKQFFTKYIEPLPGKFFNKYSKKMSYEHLLDAKKQLVVLVGQSKSNIGAGHETVKNTFLGGMRDGESWGLRRWLSKHGGALKICNDLELIFQAIQKLNRGNETTNLLAKKLRPLASNAKDKLKRNVPQPYQELSSAHPYLPFFHRLESALCGLSNFDPEDDDVVIIDDEDEIEEVKTQINIKLNNSAGRKRELKIENENKKTSNRPSKRRMSSQIVQKPATSKNFSYIHQPHDEDEDSSDVEIVCIVDKNGNTSTAHNENEHEKNTNSSRECQSNSWICEQCQLCNDKIFRNRCIFCGKEKSEYTSGKQRIPAHQSIQSGQYNYLSAFEMAQKLQYLAKEIAKDGVPFRQHTHRFWTAKENYAFVLHLFVDFLQKQESQRYIDPIDQEKLKSTGQPDYSSIIVNPLCFRDIFNSLFNSYETKNAMALLSNTKLTWDMWDGKDLIEAMDLVLLNSLAYYGKISSSIRSNTLSLRNKFWYQIHERVCGKSGRFLPIKRDEGSSFVVRKGYH